MKNKVNALEEGAEVMLDFCKLQNYFSRENGREKKIMPVVVQNWVNNAGACHTKDENGYRAGCYYRKMLTDKKLEKAEKEVQNEYCNS